MSEISTIKSAVSTFQETSMNNVSPIQKPRPSWRLDPEEVANVLTFLSLQRGPENEMTDLVSGAYECGHNAILRWLAECLNDELILVQS
jgi:hypothetical protein